MKPVHWLALGSAIAACISGIGSIFIAKDAPADRPVLPIGGPRPQIGTPSARHFERTDAPESARSVGRSEARIGEEFRSSDRAFRIEGNPPADLVTEESVWFANAERVAREANHQLETLRESLELSPYQEQRIFGILARRSSSWMPGMNSGGSNAAEMAMDEVGPTSSAQSVTDDILPVLDEEQQQALIDEELDRRAWWEEVLPQLLPPEFPSATGSDEHDAAAGDTKAYEGPTELLEE